MRSIACVVGARPNFVKMGPILSGLHAADPQLSLLLVHTGQHYDEAMSDLFFRQLGLPAPDVHLEVGSGSQGEQTAKVLSRYEAWLLKADPRPAATLVVGDVNSTLACTLASVKLGVPAIHVEAGLRSFDRTMPEEINRVLTDAIAELLLVSEPDGVENLLREGRPESAIRLVGNVMIDVLYAQLPAARALRQPASDGPRAAAICVVDNAPAVECRCAGDIGFARGHDGADCRAAAGGVSGASAHACAAGIGRPMANVGTIAGRATDASVGIS